MPLNFKPLIDEDGKKALFNYKFSGGKSALDELIVDPWWNYVATFYPMWLAPNVITLCGTVIMMSAYMIWLYYCGTMEECAPSWVYVMLGWAVFIYQTLDGTDGKQARRTGSSSPLGQLFDHGCDALIFTPIVIPIYAACQYGTTWKMQLLFMMCHIGFYALNWRARHEGKMHFSKYFAVSEVQFIGIATLWTTAAFGCELWITYIPIPNTDISVSVRSIVILGVVFGALYTISGEYIAVRKLYKNSGKVDPGSHIELMHLVLYLVAFCSWAYTGVFSLHPRTFMWIETVVFSGMIHRLIVSDVTHMKARLMPNLLMPLPAITLLSWLQTFAGVNLLSPLGVDMTSPLVVAGVFLYAATCWFVFVARVMNEISNALNIRAFVITKPKQ